MNAVRIDNASAVSRFLPKGVLTVACLLGVCTFLVYLPALNFDFVNWDDDFYIYDNPNIRMPIVRFMQWAFIGKFPLSMWHPLTWLSLWVDRHVWGPGPMGFHATNIILHGLNTGLVTIVAAFLILIAKSAAARERGSGLSERGVLTAAAVTGILFGFHPIHVESVAWISERKDVLCAFFFLAGLLAYLRYAGEHPPEVSPSFFQGRSSRLYYLTLILFGLALMSKPMAVMFPLVLLILDWHPLGRFDGTERRAGILLEKLPFFALSLADFVMALAGPRMENVAVINVVPLPFRLLSGTQAPALYLWKMIVPVNLLAYYPYPQEISLVSLNYLIPYIVEIGIIVSCVMLYRTERGRSWTAGWGYFIITLSPVLQFFPIGYESLADRYTYLTSLGPFLLAGLGFALVFEARAGKPASEFSYQRLGALAAAGVLIIGLSLLTVRQTAIWRNSLTFWNYVIEKSPNEVGAAYNDRGLFFLGVNKNAEALQDFDAALAINPMEPDYYMNRAAAYYKTGQYDKAAEDYTALVKLRPNNIDAYLNRAAAYYKTGLSDKAIEDYTAVVKLQPKRVDAYINRGNIHASRGRYDKAIGDFTSAIAVAPDKPFAYLNRGSLYRRLKKYDSAIADFSKALSLAPNLPEGYFNRGNVYRKLGNTRLAAQDFETACRLGYEDGCRGLSVLGGANELKNNREEK